MRYTKEQRKARAVNGWANWYVNQCAYLLKERLCTLDALVRKGCAKKINPGGAGALFSPTTFWLYRTA